MRAGVLSFVVLWAAVATAPGSYIASAQAEDGRFEYRYVRRDNCGTPFEMVTSDPATGAQKWRYSGGQRFYGGPAISGSTLVIGDASAPREALAVVLEAHDRARELPDLARTGAHGSGGTPTAVGID